MKIISLVLVCVFATFCFVVVLPSLNQPPQSAPTHTLLTLWNVDNFPSGKSSKADWLKKTALTFEKQNKGVIISVVNLTQQQAVDLLNQGKTFDLICFSLGIGNKLLPLLAPYKGKVCSGNNFTLSAVVNKVVYALPFMAGGYCFFARASQLKGQFPQDALNFQQTKKVGKNLVLLDSLHYGTTNTTLVEVALALTCGKAEKQNFDQYSTYVDFVRGKFVALLSTQRDLWRLKQRMTNGKIENLVFAPCQFTDLVQYVGVSKQSQQQQIATEFCQFLQTDVVQQTLVDAGMFSVVGRNDYTDEWYFQMQEAVNVAKTVSVFCNEEQIAHLKNCAYVGKDTLLDLIA